MNTLPRATFIRAIEAGIAAVPSIPPEYVERLREEGRTATVTGTNFDSQSDFSCPASAVGLWVQRTDYGIEPNEQHRASVAFAIHYDDFLTRAGYPPFHFGCALNERVEVVDA